MIDFLKILALLMILVGVLRICAVIENSGG